MSKFVIFILCLYLSNIYSQKSGVSNSPEWNSLQEMNAYFEKRFIRSDKISLEEWEKSLPTENEKNELGKLINYLMNLSSFKNLSSSDILSSYPNLKKSLNITFYKIEYAVIHEIYNPSDTLPFRRYWGYAVIASKGIVSTPNLHQSAPHFIFDGNVCNQSAAIFEQTFSRTVVVHGAHRYAVKNRVMSQCQNKSGIADPSHNNLTMFHAFNEAILAVVKKESEMNYFIQWHGMSDAACPNTTALISAGGLSRNPIYQNASAPVNKLRNLYGNGANTPATDPTCNLAGSSNIFGRLVDGVEKENVCTIQAKTKDISGTFIHIEQDTKERDDWNGWIKAIKKAFNLKIGGKLF